MSTTTTETARHLAVHTPPQRFMLLAKHNESDEFHVVMRGITGPSIIPATTTLITEGWVNVVAAQEVLA